MRRGGNEAELGARRGSYPIAGVTGTLLQMFRRFAILFCLILLGFNIYKGSDGDLSKGLIAAAVILGLVGLRAAWGWTSARLGVRVCHIHTGGLVVTGLFGQVKHVVPWDRLAVLKHMSNLTPLLTFHRFDLVRTDAKPVAILVLKAKPEFVPALKRATELAGMRSEE
ncbi:hypothetical protein ACICHK_03210 [Streptomyces sp. AHU1]|uniref:hypothetical protein n=1 Tax=Streptomyces sp. AHU1 TaxID=3377215 RepID=UPI00387838A3